MQPRRGHSGAILTALRLAILAAPADHAPVAAVSAWVEVRTVPDHGRALGSCPTHRAGAVLATRRFQLCRVSMHLPALCAGCFPCAFAAAPVL
ncbi:hypothetical protein [Acinetobacter variabilis]|uniref:hypothetical protein n=2 Tax=Gammaproteobacteria TaxID=1236 RepID=UPI00132F9FA0|nr:hypothetical protein [Acinetobacter variabilis]